MVKISFLAAAAEISGFFGRGPESTKYSTVEYFCSIRTHAPALLFFSRFYQIGWLKTFGSAIL